MYFTDACSYFDDFYLKSNIYLFGFQPEGKAKTIYDENIHQTIVAVLLDFFKNKNNVLTFVADITDAKQTARYRLFSKWKSNTDITNNFDKIDIEIISDDELYYSSMILHKENIHKKEYKNAFVDATKSLNK